MRRRPAISGTRAPPTQSFTSNTYLQLSHVTVDLYSTNSSTTASSNNYWVSNIATNLLIQSNTVSANTITWAIPNSVPIGSSYYIVMQGTLDATPTNATVQATSQCVCHCRVPANAATNHRLAAAAERWLEPAGGVGRHVCEFDRRAGCASVVMYFSVEWFSFMYSHSIPCVYSLQG